MIRAELRLLATALTFLSRCPGVARVADPTPAALARSSRYFPLVGVLVGALGGALFAIASCFFVPAIAATLALLGMVLSTGAFHEDGLADSADGFGGAFDTRRKLEIMKDSRIGTYGAVALLFALLLKWSALQTMSAGLAVLALISAHAVARWSSLPLTLYLPYARGEGPNKPLAEGIRRRELWIASLFTLVVVLASCWLLGATPAFAGGLLLTIVLLTVLAAWICQRQIGGVTGDTLGAANQLLEIAVLLYFAQRLAI